MAKGQKRGNRETKKPKADKKPIAAATAVARNPLTAKFTALKGSK